MPEEKHIPPTILDYNQLVLKQLDRIAQDLRDAPEKLGPDTITLELLAKPILRLNLDYENEKKRIKEQCESALADCWDRKTNREDIEKREQMVTKSYVDWINLIVEHMERAGKMPR